MNETYYLGAYWGPRKESSEACAQRLQVLLQMLAQVDPLFTQWFAAARTRKKSLERPLKTDLANLKAHVQRNIMRDDTRQPMEDLGFSVWLWNGRSGDEDVGLNVLVGGYWEQANNRCMLQPPPEAGPHSSRLLAGAPMTEVLRCMAVSWEPDWAVVMSSAHREVADSRRTSGAPLVGWVTYLSRRRGTVPPLPAPVRIERVGELGTLITLTPERFTVSNPEHVALAERVRELLGRAGLLEPGRGPA